MHRRAPPTRSTWSSVHPKPKPWTPQLQIINHQPQTTNHKPQSTNHKPQATNHKSQKKRKLQTANHKPQTTNHKPQTTNHKPQTINHLPQLINYKPQIKNPKPESLVPRWPRPPDHHGVLPPGRHWTLPMVYTLNHEPRILNLHLIPETLDLKPKTFNLEL